MNASPIEIDLEELIHRKNHYILDKDNNVISADVLEWGKFFEDKEIRLVKHETIKGYFVSTIFIGIDHKYGLFSEEEDKNNYKPHIFETMVFDGSSDSIYCDRYSTWKEAEEGHKRAVEWVKNGCKEDE